MPQPIVNALLRDDYTRGAAHKSITQLIGPPQLDIIREQHEHEIETDAADGLWLLLGRALHHIAQMGVDEEHLAEERLFATVRGWTISGAMDLQKIEESKVAIGDYKFTNVWAATKGKLEWEHQLNCYSWLAKVAKNYDTERLEIYALLRDWSKRRTKGKDYPQSPILVIPVELWSFDRQQAFITERVRAHQDAWRRAEWNEGLPPCSDEERWVRRGEPIRCKDYCQAARWCRQYNSVE